MKHAQEACMPICYRTGSGVGKSLELIKATRPWRVTFLKATERHVLPKNSEQQVLQVAPIVLLCFVCYV